MEDRFIIEDAFLDYAKESEKVGDVRDLFPIYLYNEVPQVVSVYGVFDGHGGREVAFYTE